MSLVTRCPACATTFKVVKDQLRISDGWVRCGRCSEVFDATLDLHETADSAPAASTPAAQEAAALSEDRLSVEAPTHPQVETPTDEEPEADFLDDEHDDAPVAEDDVPPPSAAAALAASRPNYSPHDFAPTDKMPLAGVTGVVADEPWPDGDEDMLPVEEGRTAIRPPPPPPLSFPNISLDLGAPPARPSGRDELPATGEDAGNAQLQKALRRARVKSAKIAKSKARSEKAALAASAPMVLSASESEPPVDLGRRAPRWSGPAAVESTGFLQRAAVRRSFWALAVLAALLLIAQVVHQERDLVAARQPALRPVLEKLCGLTGCQLSALRQISDITIDGASFAREKTGDAYRLSFTLRNGATVPLAMPAVELSLLDTQERAVVRRVLMPAEFGAPSVLPARAERAASLPLALTGPEAAALPPVAGYRVVAFYP